MDNNTKNWTKKDWALYIESRKEAEEWFRNQEKEVVHDMLKATYGEDYLKIVDVEVGK